MSRCTPDNDAALSESVHGVQGHYTLGFDSDTVRWSDLIEDPSTDHLLRFRVAANAEIAYIAYSQRRRRFAPFCVAGVSAVAYFVMWIVDSFHTSRIPLFVLAGLLLPVISLLVTWPQVYCYRKLAQLVKLPEAVVFARVAEGVSVLTAIVGTAGGVITWWYVQTTRCAGKEPQEDAIMCQRVLSEAYVSVALYVMRPRFCIALPILALQFAASCTAQFGMKRVDDVTSLLQEVVHLALVIIAAVVLGFDERADRQRFVGLAHVRQARREVKARQAALDALTSALPPWALHRLRTAPSLDAAMALEFAQAAVVGGCDIVDFSRWSTGLLPAHVVLVLHRLFTALDAASRSHGVVKVATYADSYTVLLGMHDLMHAHATTTNPLNSVSAANGDDDALDGVAPEGHDGLGIEMEQRRQSAAGPGYRQATVRRNQRTMRRFIRWCVRSAVRSSGLVFERAVSTPRSGHSTPLLQRASGGSASSVERTVGLVFGDPTGGSGGGRAGALSGASAAAFASDSGSGADDRGDLFAEQPGSNVVSLRGAVVTGPVVGSIAGSASSLKYIIAGAAIDALRAALRESPTGVREVSLLPETDDTYEIDDEDDAADELYFRLAAVANAADIPAPHDLHDPVHLPDSKATGRGSNGRGKWGFEVLVWSDDDDDTSQPAGASSGNADGTNGNTNGNSNGKEETEGFVDVRFAPAGQSSAATAVIKRYAMNRWSVRFNDPLIERYAGAFVATSDAAATPVVSACVGGLFCVGVVISFVQWLLPTDQVAHDTSGVDPGGLALLSTAAVGLIGRALLFAAVPTLFTAPESNTSTPPAPAAPQTASDQGDQPHNVDQRSDETINDAEQLAAANDMEARNNDADEEGVDGGEALPAPPAVLFPVTWRVWVDHGLTFALLFCAARSMWFFDDTVFSASPQMIFWLIALLPSLFQQTAYWPVRATMQFLVGQVAFMLIRFWNRHDFGWDVPYNPLSLAIAAVVGVVMQYLASRSTKDSYAAGALVTELTTIARNDADLESTLLHTLLPAHAAMIANDMTHAVSYQRLLAANDASRLGYAPHAESQWHGLVVLCGRFAPPPGHSTGNGAAFSQWCVESSWRWSLLVAAINAVCPNGELEIVEGFGDEFVIAGPFERRAEADGRGAVASSHAARRFRRTSLDSFFTSSQHPSSQKGKRASDPQSTPGPASRVTNPRLRSNPASIQSSTMMSQPQPVEQLAASPVDPASAGSPPSATTAANSNRPASTRGQTHTNNHPDEREPNVRSASAAHRAFGSVRSVSDHFTAAFTTETEGAPLVATASATSVSAVASIHLLRSLLHAFSDRGGVQAGLSVGLASSALLGGRLLSYRLFGPAVREASAVLEAGSMPHGTVWYTTPAFRRAYRAAFAHTARPDHVPVHQFRGDQPDMSRAYGRSEMDIVPPPSHEPPPHSGYQHQPRHRRHPLPIADDVAPEGDATFGPLMRWRLRAAGVLMVSRVKD